VDEEETGGRRGRKERDREKEREVRRGRKEREFGEG
jgi:hypothetical protein